MAQPIEFSIFFMFALGVLTLISLLGVVVSIFRGHNFEFKGNWGGFGGALGGWELSSALVMLLLTLCFGAAFTWVGTYNFFLKSAKEDKQKESPVSPSLIQQFNTSSPGAAPAPTVSGDNSISQSNSTGPIKGKATGTTKSKGPTNSISLTVSPSLSQQLNSSSTGVAAELTVKGDTSITKTNSGGSIKTKASANSKSKDSTTTLDKSTICDCPPTPSCPGSAER